MENGTTTPVRVAGADVMTRALAVTGFYAAVTGYDTVPMGAGWVGYREPASPSGPDELAERAAERYAVTTTAQHTAAVGLAVDAVASAASPGRPGSTASPVRCSAARVSARLGDLRP